MASHWSLPPIPTVPDLIQALRSAHEHRRQWARDLLAGLFRPALLPLIEKARGQAPPPEERDRWTLRCLHWLELYLRVADPQEFAGHTVDATFCARMLLAMTRMLREAFDLSGPPPAPEPLEACPGWTVRVCYRPLERVGGDWFVGERCPGGAFWILAGDVTGHGLGAHLLARGLPRLWASGPLQAMRGRPTPPAQILERMHRELEPVLPLGIFIEAALVRLANGRATVSWAGGTTVIQHCCGKVAPIRGGGTLLGIPVDDPDYTEQAWDLHPGDEVILATDGLWDQPVDDVRSLGPDLAHLTPGGSLHDRIEDLVGRALARQPQMDDITFITIRSTPGPV